VYKYNDKRKLGKREISYDVRNISIS